MTKINGLLLLTEDGLFAFTARPAEADDMPVVQARSRRASFPKTTRIRLLNAQNHRCGICTGPLGLYDSHIDHVVPVSAGGSDDYANLQLTHMTCNLRKGAGRSPHDLDQERMPWA